MEVDRLRADLHNAQSGIEFLQKEHAVMLAGLHEEVERLQQKCSELQSRLSIRAVDGLEVELLEDKNASLTKQLEEQSQELESKSQLIEQLKEEHKWREIQLQNEIRSQQLQIEKLKKDLSYYEGRSVHRSLGDDSSSIRSLSSTSIESVDDFNERKLSSSPKMIEINSMNPSRGPSMKPLASRKPKFSLFNRDQNVSLTRQHSEGYVASSSTKSTPLFLTLMKSGSQPSVSQVKASSSSSGDPLPANYRASVATLPPIHTVPRSYDRNQQRPLVRQQLRVRSALERSNALSIDQVVPTSRRYELQTEQNDSEF